jgi:ribosomal protein S10
MVGLLVRIADGSLEAALGSINPSFRAHVRDLIDDFREAALEGKFIRITNTNNLAAEAHRFDPNFRISEDDTGFTWGASINDSSNLDGDATTSQYHQIYFDMRRVTQLENNATTIHGYQKSYDSFEIQLYHELIHIVEGDASVVAELTRLGNTVSNHDYPFDRAAAALYNQIRHMGFDLTITGEPQQAQLHIGTAGNDTLAVGLRGSNGLDRPRCGE